MAVDGSNKLGNVGTPAPHTAAPTGTALSSSEISSLLGEISKVQLNLPKAGDYVTRSPSDKLAMSWTAESAQSIIS